MYTIKILSAVDGTVTHILECENLTHALETAERMSIFRFALVQDNHGRTMAMFDDGEMGSLPPAMLLGAKGGCYMYKLRVYEKDGTVGFNMPYVTWEHVSREALVLSNGHPEQRVEIRHLGTRKVVAVYGAGKLLVKGKV